jgi:hypothetical protein
MTIRADRTIGLNPYNTANSLELNMSLVRNQEPWYQVKGGGVSTNGNVVDNIPPTCTADGSCQPAISVGQSLADNGVVVAGGSIRNNAGCGTNCKAGLPSDNKFEGLRLMDNDDYSSIYQTIYKKLGIGVTVSGNASQVEIMNMVGTTNKKIVFVEGDVNINNDIALTAGQTLLIAAKGNITIANNVNRVDALLISDSRVITLTGSNNTALTINGLVWAKNETVLSRGFGNPSLNNNSAGVVINYRPDMVFNLPGRIFGQLSGYREATE